MVRALLDGRKTQTRRVIKPQPDHASDPYGSTMFATPGGPRIIRCPYGKPGDRLWVRETFGYSRQDDDLNEKERVIVYRAGGEYITDAGVDALKRCRSGELMRPNHFVRQPPCWKPSIYMPRWASRIDLEIKAIRVERLQDISEADAIAEGITDGGCTNCGEHEPCGCDAPMPNYIDAFACLWHSIHGTESWHSNPWVWVVEFERVGKQCPFPQDENENQQEDL